MSTLLLRLAGPMQSWGVQSRFTVRDTGREPSKSGVIGLLCAALGRPRDVALTDLSSLRMGVRVDQEGTVQVDYHTSGGSHLRGEIYGVARPDSNDLETVPSHRYYLADASFLVGLEGDEELLATLDVALGAPVWSLSLGRKSFVPGEPVHLAGGLRPELIRDALRLVDFWPQGCRTALRVVVDAEPSTASGVRMDVPISFRLGAREFAPRHIATESLLPPEAQP